MRAEADLLISLVRQLFELTRADQPSDEGEDGSEDPLTSVVGMHQDQPRPTDPVLLRLFPDGYADDDAAAGDFRRYTEHGLREAKTANATTVLASLTFADDTADRLEVTLDPAQTGAWLRTLTDLRLALGTRLGVTEGDEEVWDQLDADDPRRHVHDVYDWLGWVQETLVRAASAGLGRR